MRRDYTTPIRQDDYPQQVISRQAAEVSALYRELRKQHAAEMTREVLAGNITGQGRADIVGECH